MAVQPQVSLFFPCADIKIDESNNSITIIDPISTLYLSAESQFPCSSGVFYFFADLKGGLGKFHCRIKVWDENQKIVAETKPNTIEFTQENRFDGIQFAFEMPEFELSEPGIYEFGLFANYSEKPIASAKIHFLTRG